MRFPVNIFKFFDGIMSVNLGGRKAAMPQQVFNRMEIGSVVG